MWVFAFQKELRNPKELSTIMRDNHAGLDFVKEEVAAAKRLAEDPETYRIPSDQRLSFVKQKLKDGKQDAHAVSAILQVVFDVDVNMHPLYALDAALSPFGFEFGRRLGMFDIKDGQIIPKDVTPSEMPKSEGLLGPKEDKILAELARQTEAELSERFENITFAREGTSFGGEIPEFFKKDTKLVRDVYIAQFGDAKRPKLPTPDIQPAKEFVDMVTKKILGVQKIPEYSVEFVATPVNETKIGQAESDIHLLEFWLSVHHDVMKGKYVINVSDRCSDEAGLVDALSSEVPHIAIPDKNVPSKPFSKYTSQERISFFKQTLWQEGIAGYTRERVLQEYHLSHEHLAPEESEKRLAGNFTVFAVSGVAPHLLKTAPEVAVHIDFAHFLGWHFVRGTTPEFIRANVPMPKAYLNPEMPWNKRLETMDLEVSKMAYHDKKQSTLHNFIHDREMFKKAQNSLRIFERDWSEMTGTNIS